MPVKYSRIDVLNFVLGVVLLAAGWWYHAAPAVKLGAVAAVCGVLSVLLQNHGRKL